MTNLISIRTLGKQLSLGIECTCGEKFISDKNQSIKTGYELQSMNLI